MSTSSLLPVSQTPGHAVSSTSDYRWLQCSVALGIATLGMTLGWTMVNIAPSVHLVGLHPSATRTRPTVASQSSLRGASIAPQSDVPYGAYQVAPSQRPLESHASSTDYGSLALYQGHTEVPTSSLLWACIPLSVGFFWMVWRRLHSKTQTETLAMLPYTAMRAAPYTRAHSPATASGGRSPHRQSQWMAGRFSPLRSATQLAAATEDAVVNELLPTDGTLQGDELVAFLQQRPRVRMNGQYRAEHIGEKTTAYGWVQAYRNQGGVIFVDLRDREGFIQLRFDEKIGDGSAFRLAKALRAEWVVGVGGEVISRGDNSNDKIPTGDVEIMCDELVVFSEAKTPPFELKNSVEADEQLRLKHRYLDLRRPRLAKNLITRSKVNLLARSYFAENGFLEVETPILGNPTPEGARDYLVPSRVHPGSFYALPQSPQQYKQMLMLSGVDRYMQICRCFRDEDLRADRQPEFTQLDLEMSFITEEMIRGLLDGFVERLWKEILGVEVQLPIATMSYSEAMDKYGIDRPDLRFDLPLTDLSELMTDRVDFVVFKSALEAGGIVKALYIPDGSAFSRKDLDKSFPNEAKPFGAKGVAWARVQADGVWSGPVSKGVSDDLRADLNTALGANDGGLILFLADKASVVNASLARLRVYVAERTGLIDPNKWAFTWVVDFPMFEYDEEDGRYYAMHHPFTSPKAEDMDLLKTDPSKIRAQAYDLVLNGTELGGGSIRIHQSHIQDLVFQTLGLSQADREEKFGFFLEALKYGAPPHGGLALGLDRVLTYLCDADSLRDVIAFPKTLKATDLLTGAPSEVDPDEVPMAR